MKYSEIEKKLLSLEAAEAHGRAVLAAKQAAIDAAIPEEVKEELAAIEEEFQPKIEAWSKNVASLREMVKAAVIEHGKTVRGQTLQAVYAKGRQTVKAADVRVLAKALKNDKLLGLIKRGEPSVSFKTYDGTKA